MSDHSLIKQVCTRFGNDSKRMIDILWTVQEALSCISQKSMQLIADLTGTQRVVIEGVVSFYAFLHDNPKAAIAFICVKISSTNILDFRR